MISESTVPEPRSSSVERAARPATSRTTGSSAADDSDRTALADHAEPDAGLEQIGGEGLQKGGERVGAAARHARRQARRRRRNRRSPAAAFAVASAGQLAAAFRKAAPCSMRFACAVRAIRQALRRARRVRRGRRRRGAPPAFGEQHRIVPARADGAASARSTPAGLPRRRPAPSCDGALQPMAVAERRRPETPATARPCRRRHG